MALDRKRAREVHFERIQKTLEDGLRAINMAHTIAEAGSARLWTQIRLKELNKIYEDAFPKEK